MNLLKDKNGKSSTKRILGAIGVIVGLIMGILKFWLDEENRVTDTLILGILTTSFGAIVMGVFEKKQ